MSYSLQDQTKFTALISSKRNPDEIVAEVKGKAFLNYRNDWVTASNFEMLTEYPIHLVIELNHSCNLTCQMCTWSANVNKNQGKSSWMDFDLYKSIIDEGVSNGLKSVALNAVNEPLIRPDLHKFVSYADQKGILDIIIHTNGMLLSPPTSAQLIDSGLTKLMVSLDAFTQETYDKIRTGGNLKQITENIHSFLEVRSRKQSRLPVLSVNFVKMKTNQHELDEFVNYWDEYVDYFAIQEYMNPFPDDEDLAVLHIVDDDDRKEFRCSHPWQRAKISANGSVYPCCSFYADDNTNVVSSGKSTGNDIRIGLLEKNSIKEIWMSEDMKLLRQLHKDGRWHEHPVCRQCVRNSVLRD